MSSKRNRLSLYLTGGGLGVFAFVTVGVLWFLYKAAAYKGVSDSLPKEWAAAKAAGIPMEIAELKRHPPTPPALNAAPLYRQITKGLQSDKELDKMGDILVHLTKGKATPQERTLLQRLLKKHQPQLALAIKAASLPECDFQRDWSLGMETLFPEYRQLRALIRLIAGQALLLNEVGKPLDALEWLERGAHIAHHTGQEPITISTLSQIALEAILDWSWQEVVKRHGHSLAVRRKAAQVDAAFGPLPAWQQATLWECCLLTDAIHRVRDQPDLAKGRRAVRFVTNAQEARIISYFRRAYQAVQKVQDDPLESYFVLKRLETEALAQAKGDYSYVLHDTFLPVGAEVALQIVHCAAQRRQRTILLALMAYRQQQGNFPTRLAELQPAPPHDPFLRQPFHYRKTPKGFLLYSVGKNLQDDGGVKRNKQNRDSGKYDTVVEYP